MTNSNLYFENLLINAIDICSGMFGKDITRDFQALYPFTTENIAGYINNFNLADGTLLTVGSSGDQVINASLFDCQDIVCLDICPYTKFYTYLKISCLLELDKNNFLTFLRYKHYPITFKNITFEDNILSFNKEVYKKLKSTLRLLDYESYLFWDELFSNYRGIDIRKRLFCFDEEPKDVIVKSNPYLQSNIDYDEARKKIKRTKIEFITDDIFKTEIDRSFDSIWLSNIGSWISRESVKKMVDKMSKNLNDNGKLLISYLYRTVRDTKYEKGWQPIYALDKTFEILQEYHPDLISFMGTTGIKFEDSSIKDSILIYKKTNTHNI